MTGKFFTTSTAYEPWPVTLLGLIRYSFILPFFFFFILPFLSAYNMSRAGFFNLGTHGIWGGIIL